MTVSRSGSREVARLRNESTVQKNKKLFVVEGLHFDSWAPFIDRPNIETPEYEKGILEYEFLLLMLVFDSMKKVKRNFFLKVWFKNKLLRNGDVNEVFFLVL